MVIAIFVVFAIFFLLFQLRSLFTHIFCTFLPLLRRSLAGGNVSATYLTRQHDFQEVQNMKGIDERRPGR